jgi:hypothetical protein
VVSCRARAVAAALFPQFGAAPYRDQEELAGEEPVRVVRVMAGRPVPDRADVAEAVPLRSGGESSHMALVEVLVAALAGPELAPEVRRARARSCLASAWRPE